MRKKHIFRKLIAATFVLAVLLLIVFLSGRYGWKMFGFNACESAGIESVEVTDNQVQITGFYPGSFPQGFLGYHAEEEDGTLYVGFKFSGLFGIFETGDFDITIPVRGEIKEVVIKNQHNENPIWPDREMGCTSMEEDDVFSLGMESMSETRKKTFTLEKGDAIDVSMVYIAGEIDISITDSKGNAVYEGHNPELSSFQVNIQESGDYTISVTGKQAEGSISFQILRNKE